MTFHLPVIAYKSVRDIKSKCNASKVPTQPLQPHHLSPYSDNARLGSVGSGGGGRGSGGAGPVLPPAAALRLLLRRGADVLQGRKGGGQRPGVPVARQMPTHLRQVRPGDEISAFFTQSIFYS